MSNSGSWLGCGFFFPRLVFPEKNRPQVSSGDSSPYWCHAPVNRVCICWLPEKGDGGFTQQALFFRTLLFSRICSILWSQVWQLEPGEQRWTSLSCSVKHKINFKIWLYWWLTNWSFLTTHQCHPVTLTWCWFSNKWSLILLSITDTLDFWVCIFATLHILMQSKLTLFPNVNNESCLWLLKEGNGKENSEKTIIPCNQGHHYTHN